MLDVRFSGFALVNTAKLLKTIPRTSLQIDKYRPRQRVVPIEVKSGKPYKRHSALTKSLAVENWGIDQAIVLYDGNVEESGKVLYLPVYMAMFV